MMSGVVTLGLIALIRLLMHVWVVHIDERARCPAPASLL